MSGDSANTNGPARALMVQGTGSDVGKSLLVAGLCRAFHRRGLRVRPFKPQNMSNNAAVASDGNEIGRAQALQAQAAGVRPSVHMNPVLLKPEGETGAQLVVQGRIEGRVKPKDFRNFKKTLLPRVLESFGHLKAEADLVLIEGAGSPAEINLRDGDIANFGFASAADVPVILVGDVEKGGVIAQLVGTHAVLEADERDRVQGFVVNKFRGDVQLFTEAVLEIEARTGWPGLGTVPWLEAAGTLPKEDSASLGNWIKRGAESAAAKSANSAGVHIAVFHLPRIANFDDLDPLMNEDDVEVTLVEPGGVLPRDADVAIIPGSKAVISDLRFLKAQGWDVDIKAFHRLGGKVVGLCGGYQMLGERVVDPDGVEGSGHDEETGLELLSVESILTGDKTLEHVSAVELSGDLAVEGYEMHLGLTEGPDRARPWFRLSDGRHEGAVSDDGQVMGTYLHGLFQSDGFRGAFLTSIGGPRAPGASHSGKVEAALDQLADHLEAHLDLDRMLEIAE